MRRIDDQAALGVPWMFGDDRLLGEDLHHAGSTAQLDAPTDVRERHGILTAFEVHQSVVADRPRCNVIERLRQPRQRSKAATLVLPGLPHAAAGDRTATPARRLLDGRVAHRLQLSQVVPRLPLRIESATAGAHGALDLALVLRAVRRARVDMEAHRHRVAAVSLVELTPRAGTVRHCRLRVVDPDHGWDPAQPDEGRVVAGKPRQLRLIVRPHHRLAARMRQHEVEGVQGQRFAGNDHAWIGRPIGLCLGAGRRLDATSRPPWRSRIGFAHKPLHRTQAAGVVMLGDQPVVQRREVAELAVPGDPMVDRVTKPLRAATLPGTAVDGAGRDASKVIADRALAQLQLARDGTVGLALRGQRLDRHA